MSRKQQGLFLTLLFLKHLFSLIMSPLPWQQLSNNSSLLPYPREPELLTICLTYYVYNAFIFICLDTYLLFYHLSSNILSFSKPRIQIGKNSVNKLITVPLSKSFMYIHGGTIVYDFYFFSLVAVTVKGKRRIVASKAMSIKNIQQPIIAV